MTGRLSVAVLWWVVVQYGVCGGEVRRWVMSSWCGHRSVGVGYSHGEVFSCWREKGEVREAAASLEGITLRIGIIEGDDFQYDCSATPTTGGIQSKGYSAFLLSLLRDVLRFNLVLKTSTSWGYHEDSNHTWKGLAGLLSANVTDVTACHWTPTRHLFDLADFLFPTLETTQSFVYLPQNVPLTGDIFVEALSRKVWLFFLLSIFSLTVSFWFSTCAHSKVRPGGEAWSWDEAVLWAVAAVSQQSYSRQPRGASCRTMFLIGYVITYLLYTGLAAGITSLLALKSNQKELTLEEVAQRKLQLLLLRDEYNVDFFEKYHTMFDYLDLQEGEGDSLQQIFHKIKERNFLGYGSTVTFLNYLRTKLRPQERAPIAVVPAPRSTRRKAFLVQKSFPHKRLLNYWLLRFKEAGLLDLGKKRYLKFEDDANARATGWFSAGLENVFSAVAFLLAGWLLSWAVLLAEILQENNRKRE